MLYRCERPVQVLADHIYIWYVNTVIANCSRWKSFVVAKLNCNLLENICSWIVVMYGQNLLHRLFHFAVTDWSAKTAKLFHLEQFVHLILLYALLGYFDDFYCIISSLVQINEDSYNTIMSICRQRELYILELQGQLGRAQQTTRHSRICHKCCCSNPTPPIMAECNQWKSLVYKHLIV